MATYVARECESCIPDGSAGANIRDLDVTAINLNGCTFTVVETVTELVPELPTDVYSLAGGKTSP